jgi:hypothetical protein
MPEELYHPIVRKSELEVTPDNNADPKGEFAAERSLITAFILPQRRSRHLELLASRTGRDKWRRQLAHFSHWDPRFLLRAEGGRDAIRRFKALAPPRTVTSFPSGTGSIRRR